MTQSFSQFKSILEVAQRLWKGHG